MCSQIERPALMSAVNTGGYLSNKFNYMTNVGFVNVIVIKCTEGSFRRLFLWQEIEDLLR